ncbi:MAG: 16S rRNA (cytidine(1402)-2'-O)-methyltransferase [Anaerolineales bacterium]|jgi:16S rRNA (cytidine1402-2'-O)-methyltransferase
MGTLYLVATPIGNLEDMSPRAVRTLREARLIAAEDTRVTRNLLTHFKLHTPLTSYFEHNKLTKLDAILAELTRGDVALVSDAGTPAINDPGYELVRAAIEAEHTVCPIPGPSAPLAALAASGLPTDSFIYLGYLPRKSSERRELLRQVETLPYTLLFLESPHRLPAALHDLETCLGNRQIAVARELTKVHEQIWRGSIAEATLYFTQNEPRGEFTLVVAGRTKRGVEKWSEDKVKIAIKFGLKLGESPSVLAKRVAQESGWKRKEIYNRITAIQG